MKKATYKKELKKLKGKTDRITVNDNISITIDENFINSISYMGIVVGTPKTTTIFNQQISIIAVKTLRVNKKVMYNYIYGYGEIASKILLLKDGHKIFANGVLDVLPSTVYDIIKTEFNKGKKDKRFGGAFRATQLTVIEYKPHLITSYDRVFNVNAKDRLNDEEYKKIIQQRFNNKIDIDKIVESIDIAKRMYSKRRKRWWH